MSNLRQSTAAPDAFAPEWRWPNFEPSEFRCQHSGLYLLVPRFLDKLQALRSAMGVPFPLTSAYRHPSHPNEARKARPGAHATGRAVDIAVEGEAAWRLLSSAADFGFTGIGVAQKGGSRFIHLDDLEAREFHAPRPTVWSY